MTDLPTLSHTSASEIATISCTRSLEIGMLFGSSLQGCSLDFSKGTHNFPNLSAPPPPLSPHFPPQQRFHALYIQLACAFPLLLSKYIGPPMNHAWPRWKPTFRCKKEKSSLFQKKYFSETSNFHLFAYFRQFAFYCIDYCRLRAVPQDGQFALSSPAELRLD